MDNFKNIDLSSDTILRRFDSVGWVDRRLVTLFLAIVFLYDSEEQYYDLSRLGPLVERAEEQIRDYLIGGQSLSRDAEGSRMFNGLDSSELGILQFLFAVSTLASGDVSSKTKQLLPDLTKATLLAARTSNTLGDAAVRRRVIGSLASVVSSLEVLVGE